jgi:hypothetical protein
MYWLWIASVVVFWVVAILVCIRIVHVGARGEKCRMCKGTGMIEDEDGLGDDAACNMCHGTGRRTPANTWRMETGKGGRLWWTCSNGTRVCGLCPECSPPGHPVAPSL